jgi:F0F1-type ATP synthase membrane subunit b/b'
MEKSKIEKLAIAVAMVEYYQQIIDNAKEEIRNLTDKEVAEINKGKDLIISRQNYTKTIYSKEYQDAKKEIEKKFPPKKETIVNHTIKLTATAYTTSKRELITEKFTNLNKAQLTAAGRYANIK